MRPSQNTTTETRKLVLCQGLLVLLASYIWFTQSSLGQSALIALTFGLLLSGLWWQIQQQSFLLQQMGLFALGSLWFGSALILWPISPETLILLNLHCILCGMFLFAWPKWYLLATAPTWPAFLLIPFDSLNLGLTTVFAVVQVSVFRASILAGRLKKQRVRVEALNESLETQVTQRTQELERKKGQLKLAMHASEIGIWDWDLEHRQAFVSDRYNLMPESQEANALESFRHWIHPEDYPSVRSALIRHLKGQTDIYQVRFRIRQPDDKDYRWFEDSGKAIEWNDKGRVSRMIGTRRDVTIDMALAEDLRLSASLFNHTEDGVFVLDTDLVFKTANPAFCTMMGLPLSELAGMHFNEFSATPQIHQVLNNLKIKGKWQGELLQKRQDDSVFPFKCQLNAIYDHDRTLCHYIGIGNDLTHAKRAQIEIDYLANYDKLTGLANRSHFHQVLNRLLKDPASNTNALALVIVNLDRFQSINDSLGFDVGDQMLKDAAARLSNLPPPSAFVARLGGDEFVIIAEYFRSRDELKELLTNIVDECGRPYFIDDHELIVTASLGVAILDGNNRHQLLNQATVALNQARYNGGNNFQFFNSAFQASPFDRLQLEKSLRKAVAQREFSVNYQPKLNLKTGTIDSVEALVRWHHHSLGLIEPEQFIPLAEETGLITAIGEQVLYKACDEASTWRQRGFGNIRVSVNLSSHQLRKENLYDAVSSVLNTSLLPSHLLELELTESVIMENIDHSIDTLNRLHALGVRIALDDFGTGYSSLSYLQKLPLDVLKIDKSFIKDIDHTLDDCAIIKAIIAMGNSLNMEVVAEGVEHRDQMDFLENQGCHYAQGYLVSHPLPASEILNLLRHYNYRNQNLSDSVH